MSNKIRSYDAVIRTLADDLNYNVFSRLTYCRLRLKS